MSSTNYDFNWFFDIDDRERYADAITMTSFLAKKKMSPVVGHLRNLLVNVKIKEKLTKNQQKCKKENIFI